MKCFVAPVAAAMLLAACSDKAAPPPPAPRIVKAMTVGVGTGEEMRSFGGDVRARHETLAGFRVGGKLVERVVDAGSVVKPGQVLARLDAADLGLRVGEAEAQRALAEADAKRFRDLRERNFVSQAALDARDTARTAAASQATLARNQASYATLTADRAGVVAEVLAQPGQVVAAGQPVLRMAWYGEREIAVAIPEDAMSAIRIGSPAEVALWSAPDKRWQGRVRELAPLADPATRTYAARVSVAAGADLPLGMSATVKFKLPPTAGLTVPMSSLFQQGEQPALWVIGADNKLVLRPVKVAAYTDGGVRIAEGLAPGERIVSAGANRLQAGETVQIAKNAP